MLQWNRPPIYWDLLPALCHSNNRRKFSTVPQQQTQTALTASEAIARKEYLSQIKRDSLEILAYWNTVLSAEEEALQSKRPWQQLEFIPAVNLKQLITSEKGKALHTFYRFSRRRFDDRRALMSPDVHLLHYPFEPSTQPDAIDPLLWRDAFKQARLFLLGTRHDTIRSCREVALLMNAVYADFVMLGVARPDANLLVGCTEYDLKPRVSQNSTNEVVVRRLIQEGIDKDVVMATMGKWKISHKIEQLHKIRQYAQKYMAQWSEFKTASDSLNNCLPGCAGFVLGLPATEKLDRLVDLVEDFVVEAIAMEMDPDRVPQFGAEQQEKMMDWVNLLAEQSNYRSSVAYRFRQIPYFVKFLKVDEFKKYSEQFDHFIDKEFPGFRAARVARQNRHLVRTLHTLIHRGTIEKLCAAKRLGVETEFFNPLTVIAIVGHRQVDGIKEIWDRPDEVYTGMGRLTG